VGPCGRAAVMAGVGDGRPGVLSTLQEVCARHVDGAGSQPCPLAAPDPARPRGAGAVHAVGAERVGSGSGSSFSWEVRSHAIWTRVGSDSRPILRKRAGRASWRGRLLAELRPLLQELGEGRGEQGGPDSESSAR
jgi:hypothetical protein